MGDVAMGTDGNPANPNPLGAYLIPINVRATAATAACTIWAMRNGTTKTMYIRRIHLMTSFDGTAAASTAQYGLKRFSAATPSGGTAIAAIKKRSNMPTSSLADARFADTGLTVTSVVFETAMLQFGAPRQNGASGDFQMNFDIGGDENYDCVILAPNEGLAIQTLNAAVIGDNIQGYLEYDERLG